MKNMKAMLPVLLILLSCSAASAQKTMSEGAITYNLAIRKAGADTAVAANTLGTATVTEYVKGSLSRTDMASSLGSESILHDAKSGDGVILKEYSGQKLMITLTKDNWIDRNKKFDSVVFKYDTAVKKVNGYSCKHATAQLSDGTIISVYYTTDISVLNKEYNSMFKNLDGVPVSYSVEDGKFSYTYNTTKIDFSPLGSAKFDYPRSGYRIMTYEESEQLKR